MLKKFDKQTVFLILGVIILFITGGLFIVYKHLSSTSQPINNTKYIFLDNPTTYKGVLGLSFPINTTIVKSGDIYQNTTNRFKTYFKSSPTLENSITFKNDTSQISFYTPVSQSFGQLQNPTPSVNRNVLTYPNIFPSLDLQYTISSSRLLEEFVVKDKETALKILDINQSVSLTNVDKYTKEPDGSITFYSKGNPTFIIPQPVLYEQENRDIISHGIEYQVTETGKNNLQITKKITQEGADWLADPKRKYPIVIDLVIDNCTNDANTTWISSDTTHTTLSNSSSIYHSPSTGSIQVAVVGSIGTGADGNCIMNNGTKTLDSTVGSSVCNSSSRTTAYAVNFSVTTTASAGATSVTVSSTPNGLLAGDEFLIINLQGTSGNYSSVGQYETHTISSISTNTLNFTDTPLLNTYDGTTQKIMVQRVPNFGNVTICGGNTGGGCTAAATLTTSAWNGTKNGVLFFTSNGTINVNSGGVITANALGYQGGTGKGQVNGIGPQGYSRLPGGSISQSANDGGGGGGQDSSLGAGGSGGGGYGTAGSTGGVGGSGSGPGTGGSAYGSDFPSRLYLGSGAGGAADTGGNGGGIIAVYAVTFTSTGSATSNGGGGHSESNWSGSGGGSGGSISISASSVTAGTITVSGGSGGSGYKGSNGGNGGSGRSTTSPTLPALNDTVTLTEDSTVDLSGVKYITFWVYSGTTGSFAQFQFGQSSSSENTDPFTINVANQWQEVTWDISGLAPTRSAIKYFAFKITSNPNQLTFYFDDIESNTIPVAPTLGPPSNNTQHLLPSSQTLSMNSTDADGDYLMYKVLICTTSDMTTSCLAGSPFDETSSQTGWSNQNYPTGGPYTAYTSGTTAVFTPTLSPGTTYYWEAWAIDPGGTDLWSTVSAKYSFTTNAVPNIPSTPVSPNGVTGQALLPTFTTTTSDPDGDSIKYRIKLCTDNSMGVTGTCYTADQTTTPTGWSNGSSPYSSGTSGVYTLQASLVTLNAGTTYYWESSAIDPAGSNTWGSYQASPYSFTTSQIPNIPSLDSPANGATLTSTPIILKTTGTDNDNDYLMYKIRICTDQAMSSCLTGSPFDETSSQTGWSNQNANGGTAYTSNSPDQQAWYTLPSSVLSQLQPGTIYYWDSYAEDPKEYISSIWTAGTGLWGSTQTIPYSFTMGQPNVPSALQVDGTTDPTSLTDQTPNFTAICNSGNSGDTFNKYEIIVSTSPTFSSTTYDSGSSGTSMASCTAGSRSSNLAYVGTLGLDGTVYYWKIRFFDTGGSGTWSNWSTELATFKMSSSYDNTPLTCSAGTLGAQDSSIMVQWTDSAGVTAFELQRSTDGGNTFSDLAGYSGSGTNYTDSTTSSGNIYEYRVKATSGGGSGWCTTGLVSLQRGVFQFR